MNDPRTEKLINEYLGKKFMTKDGLEEIEIIAVRSYGDVDIRFNPSGVIKTQKLAILKMDYQARSLIQIQSGFHQFVLKSLNKNTRVEYLTQYGTLVY